MIRALMELGVTVEPDAAKLLEKCDNVTILEKIKAMAPMPFSIDAATAKRLLSESARPKLLRTAGEMKNVSIPDLVAAYSERYTALQRILLKNPALANVVSIATASGECAVIGMITGGKIEDPSGTATLISDVKLSDGEVVGAVGRLDGGVLRAREIIFPGLQLKERAGTAGFFTAGRIHGTVKTDSTAFYDLNGTIIVTSSAALGKEEALELLKRRHLTIPPRDYLEPQPDFLIINSTENFTDAQKGTTLIGIKEGDTAVIDTCERTASFK